MMSLQACFHHGPSLLIAVCLGVLSTACRAADGGEVVINWAFNTGFGDVLGEKGDPSAAVPIGIKGAELASKSEGRSQGEFAWQFHAIPDGKEGGLETVIDGEIGAFALTIDFKPAEESVPDHTQYLAGIAKRLFVRITEANQLEAGLMAPEGEWKELRSPLAEFRPLNQWMEVEVRYDGNEFFLIVNGATKDSLAVENFRLPGGDRLVVAACPWDPSLDHYAGVMAALRLKKLERQ